MKKLLLLLLPLLLLFFACKPQSPAAGLEEAKMSLFSKSPLQDFTRADEDFIATNFGPPDYVQDHAVYLAQGCEAGFFTLKSDSDRAKMEKVIRAYLTRELEAAEGLAALYPSEEMQARVDRLKKAQVGGTNTFVYYLVLDDADIQDLQGKLK